MAANTDLADHCTGYSARLWRRKTLAEFGASTRPPSHGDDEAPATSALDSTGPPPGGSSETAPQQQDNSEGRLSEFDLLCIGIGGTVGSGVFVLTGDVYPVAGPSASLCWLIGAAVCLLSAFSYMELSTLVPTSGSTYAYSYHALGELAAVAGATSLTLEYGLSGAGVARSWSAKFAALCDSAFVDATYRTYGVPSKPARLGRSMDAYLDVVAALLQVACAVVVARGVSLSKRVVNVMTVLKVALVVFLIVAGAAAALKTSGFARIAASEAAFFPDGAAGVAKGTSLLFFGFIGFDEVCCMAARSKNPRKALPRAIAGTLFGAALLSTLAQLSLAGVVAGDADDDDHDDDDDATSFELAFKRRGWTWAKYAAQGGEVALLPLVVLLSFMPQPELMAALGEDGLVSRRFARKGTGGNDDTTSATADVYVFGCVACGAALTAASLVVPFAVLWNCINLGVLVGFNLSNASLISVRLGNGGAVADAASAAHLAAYATVFAPGAAYVLWKGCLATAVERKAAGAIFEDAGRAAALAIGLGLLVLAVRSLRAIDAALRRTASGRDARQSKMMRSARASSGGGPSSSRASSEQRRAADRADPSSYLPLVADDDDAAGASSAATARPPRAAAPGGASSSPPAPLETVACPPPAATTSPHADDARLFRAPGVPWVPGAAIFLNFLLMAQYEWLDHLYLFFLYGAAYATYFLADRDGRSSRSKLDDDDDDDGRAASLSDTPSPGGTTTNGGTGRQHLERPLLDVAGGSTPHGVP